MLCIPGMRRRSIKMWFQARLSVACAVQQRARPVRTALRPPEAPLTATSGQRWRCLLSTARSYRSLQVSFALLSLSARYQSRASILGTCSGLPTTCLWRGNASPGLGLLEGLCQHIKSSTMAAPCSPVLRLLMLKGRTCLQVTATPWP